MITKQKIIIAFVLFFAVLAGCASKGAAQSSAKAVAEPVSQATPALSAPVYSREYVELPEGCNMVSSLCLGGENVYFIAHFSDKSAIYSIKTDGTGLAPLAEYAAPKYTRAIALTSDSGGALWVLENNTYTAPVSGQPRTYIVRKLGADGAEMSRIDISDRVSYPEDLQNSDKIEIDGDGNIYIWDKISLRFFDNNGSQIFLYNPDGNIWIKNLLKMSDNSVSKVGLDMAAVRNGDLSHFIYEADLEKNTLTAYAKRGENMWLCAPGNSDFDYFYSDYECAGAVLFPREELKLIDWAAYGIANCVSSFAVLPENALICAARRDADFGAYNTAELSALFTGNSVAELLVFTPKAGTPEAAETPRNQDRTVLKLVSFGPFRYTDLLENFNVENSDYEIVLSEYDAAINPATFELDTDTILKFNTEIITGNIPDILMYPGSVSMNDYISKELLENLYNFIDSDLEINRGAFVPAILNSYEKDKALYRLPIGFNIATVAALKTTLDGKTAWTLNDLITLERQTGKASLPNKTSAQVLEFMLRQNLDNFINLESGICNFNGAEFIEILEYAKSFPAEIRERNPASGSTQVREGAALADTIYVSEYFSYIEHKRAYGDIKYIGYPADGGDRGMFGTFDTVSIFSKSKEKSAVWDFVRMFFSEKYQLNNPNTAWPLFPVNQAALNKTANFALEKEMTQEEIGEVNELIASVNTAAQLDYAPFRIIKEEAAPYFAGQKTAKEAADIIQSRMSIYAAERR